MKVHLEGYTICYEGFYAYTGNCPLWLKYVFGCLTTRENAKFIYGTHVPIAKHDIGSITTR